MAPSSAAGRGRPRRSPLGGSCYVEIRLRHASGGMPEGRACIQCTVSEAIMILEAVDHVYRLGQMLGKSFGVLNRAEAGIHEETQGTGVVVAFFDELPGWQAFQLPLPSESVFFAAGSGAFERYGMWQTKRPAAEVREALDRELIDRAGPGQPRGKHSAVEWKFALKGGETVTVTAAMPRKHVGIAIKQKRRRSSIEDAVRQGARAGKMR